MKPPIMTDETRPSAQKMTATDYRSSVSYSHHHSRLKPVPQTYANHASLPKFFFLVLAPVFLINTVVEGVGFFRAPSMASAWEFVVAVALLLALSFARLTAMKVQDRVIVPESAARLRAVLPADLQSRVDGLSKAQIVALRFASDAEVEPLVRKVVAGELVGATAIKKAIVHWRPDLLPRV